MKILLDKNKPFYKANLHCHSTYSDGRLTVDELKAAYMAQGYSIVAFSDHEHLIDNSRLTDESFLAITACEVAIKEFPNQSTLKNMYMRVCHLNFYAFDPHNTLTPCYSSVYDHFASEEVKPLISFDKEYERVHTAEGINEMIRIANENGFIVSYNHPSWSLENATHYLGYEGVWAVEIYNTGCVKSWHGDDEHVYDDMLRAGKKLFCTAADDNHNAQPFESPNSDSFGGHVWINADKLEYSTVMQALQKGDFYASTGPQIFSLTLDNNVVCIQTSPCQKIDLVTRGRRTKAAIAPIGERLTTASFALKDTDAYFRIRVTDENGKTAYTQAYFLDE